MTQPIAYATPTPTAPRHDLIYSALLGVLAFILLVGAMEMRFFSENPQMDLQSIRMMQLIAAIELFLLALIIAVLIVRIAFPAKRKWPTVTLNLIMLAFFPFGTALGIYGLWKVDKNI